MLINYKWPLQIRITNDVLTNAGLNLVFKRLEQLGSLPANWDGEDANPIHPQTLNNCRSIIPVAVGILPKPEVDPNPNGTISFEWETPEGFAHLEVGRTFFAVFVESHDVLVFSDKRQVIEFPALFFSLFAIIAGYLYPGLEVPTIEWRGFPEWMSGSGEDLLASVFGQFSPPLSLTPRPHAVGL